MPLQALESGRGAAEHQDPRQAPSDEAGQAEMGRLVRAALLKLEPEDRALLELRVVDEQILPTIALELSISIEQVKYRLKRAAQNLRRALLEVLPREEVAE